MYEVAVEHEAAAHEAAAPGDAQRERRRGTLIISTIITITIIITIRHYCHYEYHYHYYSYHYHYRGRAGLRRDGRPARRTTVGLLRRAVIRCPILYYYCMSYNHYHELL